MFPTINIFTIFYPYLCAKVCRKDTLKTLGKILVNILNYIDEKRLDNLRRNWFCFPLLIPPDREEVKN